ncbi:MAG: type III pantothenate kinase [Firmicutes bacterium]|nr:type III pantothenate kinase [Bacillota bacterium]
MILAVDIGNTHTVLGLFRGKGLVASWKLQTDSRRTEDEMGSCLLSLFRAGGIDKEEIQGVVVSCVVPPIMHTFEEMVHRYLGVRPLVVGPGIKTGIPVHYENPKEVGSDRIANAVATVHHHGVPAIVVDFGTATSFDAISRDGAYLGGAIAPGIWIATEALFLQTAKLPRIDLARPARAIGKNTVSSLQAGIIFGFVGMVEELVARLKEELTGSPVVVATGSYARLIAGETKVIDKVDLELTLEGLRLIYDMNR